MCVKKRLWNENVGVKRVLISCWFGRLVNGAQPRCLSVFRKVMPMTHDDADTDVINGSTKTRWGAKRHQKGVDEAIVAYKCIIMWKIVLLLPFLLVFVPTCSWCQRRYPPAFASPSQRSHSNGGKVRYRCRVAYDGSRFNGFQYQNNARTIQGTIEEVLSRRFNRTIRIVGAGRTDAGVHARGQAIHFDLLEHECLENDDELATLQHSLNRMLPQEIIVWNLQPAPPPRILTTSKNVTDLFPWHVIFNSQQKLYSYRICIASAMDPLQRHSRHHVDWGNVDITLLNSTLQHFVGTHDFRAFSGAIEQKEKKEQKQVGTVRTVYRVDLIQEEEGDGYYRIDILLKGALYKMIRNMVGTALDVSRGRMSTETFLELLHHDTDDVDQFVRDDNPCKPAPPQGLTLERVYFDDDCGEF